MKKIATHLVSSLVAAFKEGQTVYVDAVMLSSAKSHRVKIIGASFEPDNVDGGKNFLAVGISVTTADVVLMTGFDQGASLVKDAWTYEYGAVHLMSPPHQWTADPDSAKLDAQIEVETKTAVEYFKNLFNKN